MRMQVVAHLRRELASGRWGRVMPGSHRLARELGVNRKTTEAALAELERLGVVENQGAGRRRRIVAPLGDLGSHRLRIAILDYEPLALTEAYAVELQHLLLAAGHTASFTAKSLTELGMDLSRVRRLVDDTDADAWVVCSASREVLQWFAAQPVPALALFGWRHGLPMASVGPDKARPNLEVTRELIRLGHRRIVRMCRKVRRLPVLGPVEQAFASELATHGIAPSAYHLPDWEETVDGFHACLDSLFRLTAPSALILDEPPFYTAALQFCAQRGLRVPEDVSLACGDNDLTFGWCRPTVAHIRWDTRPVLQRIVRWAANVSHGKKDLRQTMTPAEFVPGGSIGPVRGDLRSASGG
jgi:DNA-binding LacI/PurR family transcriptional regulator